MSKYPLIDYGDGNSNDASYSENRINVKVPTELDRAKTCLSEVWSILRRPHYAELFTTKDLDDSWNEMRTLVEAALVRLDQLNDRLGKNDDE